VEQEHFFQTYSTTHKGKQGLTIQSGLKKKKSCVLFWVG